MSSTEPSQTDRLAANDSATKVALTPLLLVEDDPAQYQILTKILAAEGFSITLARSGEEVSAALAQAEFPVAIVDLRLPDADGVHLVQTILERNALTRIIIHTAYSSFESAKAVLNLGAFAYVEKLSDPEELLRHVDRAMREHYRQYTQMLEDAVAERTALLQESEMRLRQMAENIDQVFWLFDWLQRRVIYASPAFETIYGRSLQALQENSLEWLYATHPEDQPRLKHSFFNQSWESEWQIEYRILRPDGSQRWMVSRGFPLRNDEGQIYRIAGVSADITQRKEMEDALRKSHLELEQRVQERTAELESEQNLLRKLLDLQESERQLISCEIHDGFVQQVVGAHMLYEVATVEWQQQQQPLPVDWPDIGKHLQSAIAEGRRLMGDLRPLVVDEQGIVAALRYLAAEAESTGKFDIDMEFDVQFTRLSSLLEGCIFRIAQEALNNVKRHSRASEVEIELTQQGDHVTLCIRDNGIGVDLAQVSPERFGLRGIRERARLFGGKAALSSHPGAGMTVSVWLPLAPSWNSAGSP